VYDMYPWNDRPGQAPSDRRGARLPAPRDGRDPLAADASDRQETGPSAETDLPAETDLSAETGPAAEAMQAVQFALDRRDNGGDAVGAVSPVPSDRPRQ
jgi:hypothetical protein